LGVVNGDRERGSKSRTYVGCHVIGHIALHDAEGEALLALVRQKYAGADLDKPVTLWGQESKLGLHLGHISQELAYHTGQVSLLRQALVPDWDYFGDVFGMSAPALEPAGQ
ncbi:MAG: hypothetical protein V4671_27865, partial [Armatimonadota bacterium]